MFASLKMIAYMDDVVLIGDLNIVKQATVCFKELLTKIGLRLNLLKCVLLSNYPVSTIVDGIEIQAKLYSIDAFRHLGSFLENNDEITKNLFEKLNSISDKIDRMMNLDIKKHIKFTIIRLCFSSNFNHIFRSTNPLVTRPLAQKFNELRAKVLSQLLGCKMFQIPDHAYLSPHYGGLGWTKASIPASCAFVGGCRNAIFEFSERFADWEDLLMATQSSTVFALNEEISKIDVEKWGRCFPQSFNGNIPEKNVLNLHSLLLEKGVCENKSSDSSLFVTIVPRRFGLCANNEAFVTKMRLKLNIPINQLLSKEKCICSNSPRLSLRHALNCSKLITYRSSLHDAVRDTVFNMAQTARISGDVYCDWIDNSETIVDFVSCNVANDTLVHRRKLNPVAALDFKAKEKHRKNDKDIEEANVDRNTQLVFIAFPFSINGRLSVEAETFLDDFQKMVQEKTMKRFDIFLWRSRIQFAIINRLPRFFNRIREALARQQVDQDFVEEILVQ
ncbi:hypothetical protein P9112_011836 [Eukaryota sp. TZLM1-RC]